MYLSRLRLDPRERRTGLWLADVYRVHQRLLMAWPDGTFTPAGAGPRMLFRIETPEAHAETVSILVQAPVEADWDRCFADFPVLQDVAQKPVSLHLSAGQRLRFRLRANPTRRVRSSDAGDSHRGQRVDLRHDWEQLQWLERHVRGEGNAPCCGVAFPAYRPWRVSAAGEPATWLDLPDVHVIDLGLVRGRSRRPRPGHQADQGGLTFRAVDFNGHLQVTDPAALLAAVAAGLGPAKAFGFGLLSLAPA